MLDQLYGGRMFCGIQYKLPLEQPKATSCYLREEADPHQGATSFQRVVESDKVTPEPLFLQTKQPQLPQPLLRGFVLQTLHQLHCPSLDTLQHLCALLLQGLELDREPEEWPPQCRVPGGDACSCWPHYCYTGWGAIGLLGHLGMLLDPVQALFMFSNLGPSSTMQLSATFPQPLALPGIFVIQGQDLALGLGPPTQHVQILLQNFPTLSMWTFPLNLVSSAH
ncbi:hypothetical protein HGM15179_014580 [Zosterops borbonicus]|uniref:Uncharacterized protein n=1 Tax=Zosterops borbonicus TaxID=364589 RepID=A0A8K1LFX5_9PASS|nr:hypothetical protein HGM15179_014580 [Zosterops borbonicus]